MKALGVALAGLLLVVFIGVGVLGTRVDQRRVDTAGGNSVTDGAAVGTSGTAEPGATDDAGGPPAVVPPAIIQEIETITGAVDGHELVGRRVDLHVPVNDVANGVAFWIGEKDNRVLVVMDRGGARRESRRPAAHGILPVHRGQQAAISGTVQRLPRAEEMHSWGLTEGEAAQLGDRPIYIRADRVTANGHGKH